MYTTQEINKNVDPKYFNILGKSAFTVTLQSKNTKHCWHILDREYSRQSSVAILHTHTYGTEYHMQGQAPNLELAIKQIKMHDDYHLRVRIPNKRNK